MKEYLRSFNILSDFEIDELLSFSMSKELVKSEYFVRAGDISRDVAFIKSGTLRTFYISSEGVEVTYCINFPDNLATAYSSFITGSPTIENIQAITSVQLQVVSKEAIEGLAMRNPNWMRFMKIMAEQHYIELEKRIFQFQQESASKRYHDLLTQYPEYIQRIPLGYISSYLGITQRHLSRIRKEIYF